MNLNKISQFDFSCDLQLFYCALNIKKNNLRKGFKLFIY